VSKSRFPVASSQQLLIHGVSTSKRQCSPQNWASLTGSVQQRRSPLCFSYGLQIIHLRTPTTMPAEVISLLSSSPPLTATQPLVPTGKRTSPHLSKPSATVPASLRLPVDDFDDEFEAFDLIAHSQNSGIIPRSSLGGSHVSKPSKANAREPIETDPISLLSDDDHSSIRNSRRNGDSAGLDGPSPKRARLTPPGEYSKRPEAFQNWNFSRLNSTANTHGTKSKSGYHDHEIEDDTFASSPPRQKENKSTSAGSKRAVIDDDLDPFASSPPKRNVYQPEAPPKRAVAWDPISSSAPLLNRKDSMAQTKPRALQRVQSEIIALDDSDDSVSRQGSDEEEDFPDLANLNAAELRRLKGKYMAASRPPLKPAAKARIRKPTSGSQARAPAAKKCTEERQKENDEKAAMREAEKARKQKEKDRQREEKALEKQKAAALAEVNKVRTDKKVSTPEMIVDLPSSLHPTIKVQAETLLQDLDVESSSWNPPVENVVRWRRKVRSRWDEEFERWEPIPMRIERETYAMVIMPAAQFIQLALATEGTDLDTHVAQTVSQFPGHTVIYMLEGLTPWIRKNRNVRNRQFVSAVRSGLNDGEPAEAPPNGSQPRRRKKAADQQQYIDEDMIEDALLQMQVLHGVLIHHTAAQIETAQWIATFTQHISTVPYRRQCEETNAASAGFCMETGQVRTGDGPRDTYLRMLQEVGRITAPIAYGIAGEFPTVPQLVAGLEQSGPLVLERVRKSANKDGAFSDRVIGPAVSKRLHKIFIGTDETSTDI